MGSKEGVMTTKSTIDNIPNLVSNSWGIHYLRSLVKINIGLETLHTKASSISYNAPTC